MSIFLDFLENTTIGFEQVVRALHVKRFHLALKMVELTKSLCIENQN